MSSPVPLIRAVAAGLLLASALLVLPRAAHAERTIIPGKGFGACTIGTPLAAITKELGPPDESTAEYVEFHPLGIEVSLENGKASLVVGYYRMKGHQPFDGGAEGGIGASSTMADVEKVYGTPSRRGDSVVSEYGAMPGTREQFLEYAAKGIAFTFYDGKMGDIRVYAPKP